MKKNLFALMLTAFFSVATVSVFAQYTEEETTTVNSIPKWVSANGYWVVETTTANPSTSTLYFYNNDQVLVYKEKVDDFVFNLKKRSIKMRLKKVLDQSVVAYEQRKQAAENEMWVMNVLKK
jgi:hypothetical protein